MKAINHTRPRVGQCRHMGGSLDQALTRVLSCMGVSATRAERNLILTTLSQGRAWWHKGETVSPG